MKKISFGIVFTSLLFSLMFPLVSAAGLDSIGKGMSDFFEFIVGGPESGQIPPGIQPTEIYFVKVLVLILLLSVIYTVVQRIPRFDERKGLSFIISLIVSLLGVRYLTSAELVNFIWLPQGVLALVIISLLPLTIAFYFLEGFDSQVIRKTGWTAFLVIFAGLAFLRWEDLISTVRIGDNNWQISWALVYLIVAIISGLLIIFDRKIHAAFLFRTMGRRASRDNKIRAARILIEIKDDEELLSRTDDELTRGKIKERIKESYKRIADVLHG